jgi:hypothetical protein
VGHVAETAHAEAREVRSLRYDGQRRPAERRPDVSPLTALYDRATRTGHLTTKAAMVFGAKPTEHHRRRLAMLMRAHSEANLRLYSAIQRTERELEQAKRPNPSLAEALNSGDGSYRP